MVDRQSCTTVREDLTDGRVGAFAVRHTLDIGMDDVAR